MEGVVKAVAVARRVARMIFMLRLCFGAQRGERAREKQ